MPPWIRQPFGRTPVAPITRTKFARLGVLPLEDRTTPSVVLGAFDPLFSGDGRLTDDDSGADDRGAAVAVQADGKVVVVGSVQVSGSNYDWGLWRYNPDGTPDNTFDGNGYLQLEFTADGGTNLRAEALAVAVQSDGKIVVGGYSSTATTGEDMTVVRLTTTGAYDTTFSGDGIWTQSSRVGGNDEVSSLAIQSDGKIVLAGFYTSSGTDTDFNVVRLTSTGGVDFDGTAFFDLGGGDTDKAAGVAVQSDGKIVAVGSATTTSNGLDMAVARFTTTGALDTTFDGDGKLTVRFDAATGNYPDAATAVAIQSDGKIVIGGSGRTAAAAKPNFAVVRLTTTGGFDTTFDSDGKQTEPVIPGEYSFATALALQPDGKIVLAGYAFPSSNPSDTDAALARFTAAGALDTTFAAGSGSDTYPFDLGGTNGDQFLGLALDASGRMVAVGSGVTASAGTDMLLARVYGTDIPLTVRSATDEADGKVDGNNLSFREAVVMANSHQNASTVTFAESLNGATVALSGKRIEVQRAVTVNGPSQGVTIDGVQSSQVFYVNGRTYGTFAATFRNLTVTRGRTFTGQVVIDGSDSGTMGGGILNDRASLTLENVTVFGNTNSSISGGGVFNTSHANTNLTLRNSLMSANDANGYGGAIFHSGPGTVTAVNTTFAGNMSNSSGGAIYVSTSDGSLTFVNVTATLNRAAGGVGGFILTNGATVTMRNSIIAGNLADVSTPNEINGTVAAASSNNVVQHSGSAGGLTNGTNGNQVGVNPLLGTLGLWGGRTKVIPLLAGSPAINAGSNTAATNAGLTTDGRGAPFARVSGGTVDVGAFEVQATPVALVVSDSGDIEDGNYGNGFLTLREALRISENPGADAITFSEGFNGQTITLAGTRLEVRGPVVITGPSRGVTVDANFNSQVFYVDGRTNGTSAVTMRNMNIFRGQSGDSEELIDGFNSGAFGGGILNDRADLTLENVSVSGNYCDLEGGGIHNWNGTATRLTLRNCLISYNRANTYDGGGIYNWTGATVTAVNTTFSNNLSVRAGGAIAQNGGAITLTNVTGTQNQADSDANGSGSGGFLYIQSGTVTMHNSIAFQNLRAATVDEIGGNPLAAGSSFNLVGSGGSGGLTNGTNGNLVGVNPQLQPLGSSGGLTFTHALGQNSPALGKASEGVANYSAYDQRGTARDLGAADIGAYEVHHPLAPVGVPATNALLFAPKPSATANEAFVKGLYQGLLLRAPDAGGLANWLTSLGNGMTREQVANGFVNSTENRTNQVTFYYRYFLGREPDTGGLADWVGRLQSGQDEGTVMTGFILSPEFSANNTNPQFVNLMYYALLGRAADTAGFNDWVNRLNTGTSRADVVRDFLRSTEGLNRVVRSYFQAYLKRAADTGGLDTYRTQLLSGTTFGQAATSILSGQEFFNNAAANMN